MDCWDCEDGKFACKNPCTYIAPGSMADQALHELMEVEETFDGDGRF